MKKVLIIFTLIGILAACNSNGGKKETAQNKPAKQEHIKIKEGDVVVEKYASGINRKVQTFKKINGTLQPIYEKTFYDDGKLSQEGSLQNGKREGHWKSYYRDGTLWSEGDFEKGVAEGITITYYPNGKKRYEGQFKNGQKTGVWKFWNDKGEFVKNITFVPKGKKVHTELKTK